MIATSFDPAGADATAYAANAADGLRIALFNKDAARDLAVRVELGAAARQGRVWRLTGPALGATSGVTLAGDEVEHGSCAWEATDEELELVRVDGSVITVALPRAGAALLFVER